MTKTNKEISSDFSKEMRDKFNKRNEQLDQIDTLPIPEEFKEPSRKAIMENFEKQMDEIKSRPWYGDVRKTHVAEIDARINLIKSKKVKEKLQKEYEEKLAKADAGISDSEKLLEDAQIAHRGKVEESAKSSEGKKLSTEKINDLKWNTNIILNDLKENHVKVEENAEMMWCKWKKVHIDLPAVWDFEWFKFDYFISDEAVYKRDFEKKSELEEKSYSMSDISKLLQAMNRYMIELKGKNDWDMDYEKELKYWETEKYRCDTWDCLKAITWLDYWYWLSDKDVAWKQGSRAIWVCDRDYCSFLRFDFGNYRANLFLRLSD